MMTMHIWEQELLCALKDIPKSEAYAALEYYREMYNDKLDAGMREEAIVTEFGDPKICAQRIILENARNSDEHSENKHDSATNSGTNGQDNFTRIPPYVKIQKRKITVAEVVGKIFFTLILGIPIASILISLISSFGAIALTGFVLIPAGIIYAITAPISMIFGIPLPLTLVNIGMGIAISGVGALLFPCFFLITKYMAIGSFKLTKKMYVRKY